VPTRIAGWLTSSAVGRLQPELMHHVLGDFAGGPDVRVHEHVRLLVKRLPRGKQVADFFLRVGVVEQGTVRLVPDALPYFLRRGPEADDQRMGLEAGKVRRI